MLPLSDKLLNIRLMFSLRFSLIFLLVTSLHASPALVKASRTDSIEQQINAASDTAKAALLISYSESLKYTAPQRSLELATRALEISEKRNDIKGIASSYYAIAEVSLIKAHYEKALKNFLQAMHYYTIEDDKTGIAGTSNSLGKVYAHVGDYAMAVHYYRKALVMNKRMHNIREIAGNYNNIGQLYILQDSIDKGLSHLLVALMIADSLGNQQELINLYTNIGNGYVRLKKYAHAMDSYEKAFNFAKALHNNYMLAQSFVNISRVNYLTNNLAPALQAALNGRKIAMKSRYNQIWQDAELVLSDIYRKVGNYAVALDHFHQYKNLSDSVFDEEKAKQLAEVQAKYDLENMEKEIRLLKIVDLQSKAKIERNKIVAIVSVSLSLVFVFMVILLIRVNRRFKLANRMLKNQGEQLTYLNNQKDKFFSFVVHNLRNPFNTIFGFSELILKYADRNDTEQLKRYGKYIFESSSGIKHILSNLLEWTRLQRRNYEYNPSSLELSSLINDIVELSSKAASEKDITLNYEKNGNRYAFADRQMVYTILQNLVSNAIHFTSRDGKVTISVHYSGRFTEISVTDTGIGLSEEDIGRLFKLDVSPSDVGIGSSKGAGMGLILCKELVNKNGGEIRVHSTPGKGSIFTFSLPVPESEIEYADVKDSSIEVFIKALRKRFEKEKNLPEEFVVEMKKLLPMHERLGKALSVKELKEFSLTVIRLSQKYQVRTFKIYGQKLYKYVDELQFDKILKIFPEFPSLIKESHN